MASRNPAGRRRGGCLTIVVAAFVVIAVVAVAAGGSNTSVTAPQNFAATSTDIIQETRAAIDNAADSPGIHGSPSARCEQLSAADSPAAASGLNCLVFYTVNEPAGISNDLELFQPMRPIFRALFGVRDVQGVVIQVSGPTTSIGGKTSDNTLFTLGCNRAADSQIDWSNVDEAGLKQLCTFVAAVKGM